MYGEMGSEADACARISFQGIMADLTIRTSYGPCESTS
jgi:hypothetical protein